MSRFSQSLLPFSEATLSLISLLHPRFSLRQLCLSIACPLTSTWRRWSPGLPFPPFFWGLCSGLFILHFFTLVIARVPCPSHLGRPQCRFSPCHGRGCHPRPVLFLRRCQLPGWASFWGLLLHFISLVLRGFQFVCVMPALPFSSSSSIPSHR